MYMMPTYADRGIAHSQQKAPQAEQETGGAQMFSIWFEFKLKLNK